MKHKFLHKPRILLSALWDAKLQSYWMLPAYCELLMKLGAAPFILPLGYEAQELGAILDEYDGLLLCGGDDLNPALYGEAPHPELGRFYDPRDLQEIELLRAAMARKLPVFGICRGLQLINAALGGTLYQDLPSQFRSEVNHHMDEPYDRVSHEIQLSEDGLLAQLLETNHIGVNSCHHQGIKDLAEPLRCIARAADGLCEAAQGRDEDHYLLAVQWHPEFMHEKFAQSGTILTSFVHAAKAYREARS